MAERFQLPLPFWRMQFQLQGGHRRVWFFTLVYTAVVVAGAIAFQRMTRKEPLSQVCAWLVNALAAIQAFLIVVGGANAIHRALLRDYENKMTESHRLTPMSNIGIVLGYIIGPSLQVLLIFAVTLVLGLVISAIGQLPLRAWIVGNMFLLCAASWVWAAVVFSGMRAAKPISPAWIVFGIGALTAPIAIIPGTGLMLGVYTMMLGVFIATGEVSANEPGMYVIALVTLMFTVFWLLAAAAKYRRPDLPALNGARGLVLLLLWLIVAVGGLFGFKAAINAGYDVSFADEGLDVQWVGTLIVSLVFTTIAALGAAECRLAVNDGRQARGWGDRLSDFRVAIGAALIAAGMMALLGEPSWTDLVPAVPDWGHWSGGWALEAWCATTAALVLGTLTGRAFFRMIKGRFKIGASLILTWTILILFWSLPAIDAIRAQAVAGIREPLRFSLLSTASPTGTMAMLWTNTSAPIWTGLMIQAGLLAVITLIAHRRPDDRPS